MGNDIVRIMFTASNSWLSRLIRWFTSSRVSHSAIEFFIQPLGSWWVVDAVASGVRCVPESNSGLAKAAEFQCHPDVQVALIKVMNEYVGEPYDFGGLFGFAWTKLVWRVFRRKVRKPCHNTHGQFCSELVARLLMAADLPGTSEWVPEDLTPQDLYEYCLKHPESLGAVTITKN